MNSIVPQSFMHAAIYGSMAAHLRAEPINFYMGDLIAAVLFP
jgi:hypothetical protein